MSSKIRTCTNEDTLVLVKTVQRAFQDVAERFGLNEKNAPRHPSNCTADWIIKERERGVSYFVIENEDTVAGCVALESANEETCYLERLAVLPEQRKRGFGKTLVLHVLSQAKLLGVRYVKIGIIAEQTELKNWYEKIGFVEEESKKFKHLPFRVTFMSYTLEKNCRQDAETDLERS
jgi:N-acetylglutamate synthase-like GNAT family acetyltransferase